MLFNQPLIAMVCDSDVNALMQEVKPEYALIFRSAKASARQAAQQERDRERAEKLKEKNKRAQRKFRQRQKVYFPLTLCMALHSSSTSKKDLGSPMSSNIVSSMVMTKCHHSVHNTVIHVLHLALLQIYVIR